MLLETARLFLRPFQLQDYSHLHSRHHPTIASHPDHEMTLFDELDLFLTEPKNHPLEKQIRIALILKEKTSINWRSYGHLSRQNISTLFCHTTRVSKTRLYA